MWSKDPRGLALAYNSVAPQSRDGTTPFEKLTQLRVYLYKCILYNTSLLTINNNIIIVYRRPIIGVHYR